VHSAGATTTFLGSSVVAPGSLTRGWPARSGCGAILARSNHLLSRSRRSLPLPALSVYAHRRSSGSHSLASCPKRASLSTKALYEDAVAKPVQAALSKYPRLTPVTISKASRHSLLRSSGPLLPLLLLLLLLLLRPLYHPPHQISRFS
jgi:hypothetical protein